MEASLFAFSADGVCIYLSVHILHCISFCPALVPICGFYSYSLIQSHSVSHSFLNHIGIHYFGLDAP